MRVSCLAECASSGLATFLVIDFTAALRVPGVALRFALPAPAPTAPEPMTAAAMARALLDSFLPVERSVFAVFFIAFAMGVVADG